MGFRTVRRFRFVFVGVAAIVSIVTLGALHVAADTNQSVDIGVGDTSLTITGQTAPQAFVRVREASTTIGTTQADASGNFSLDLFAQVPGVRHLSITSKDAADRSTDAAQLYTSLSEHIHNQVHVFLPPAFIVPASFAYGQTVDISGSSFPLAVVTLVIDGHDYHASADATGAWAFHQASETLGAGQYPLLVYATDTGSTTSYNSDIHQINISAPDTPPTQPEVAQPQTAPGTAPTVPVIVQPAADGRLVSGLNEITGTSEPHRIIKLYNGHQLIGSTVSDADGNWLIRVSLETATYEFSVVACDSSDVCSQLSPNRSVVVEPAPQITTLAISLDSYLIKATAGQSTSLQIKSNKNGAYRLKILWGDGQSDTIDATTATVTATHTYQKAGTFSGTVWAERNGEVSVASFASTITAQSTDIIKIITTTMAAMTAAVVVAGTVGTVAVVGGPTATWQLLLKALLRIIGRV